MKRFEVLVAAIVLSSPLAAQGGFGGPGRYEIANVKSGKVLDLDRNNQTTVIQFSSRGTDNQTWYIRPAGDGYYYLRNGMNGYAMDSGDGRNSTPVQGVPFNGGPAQQWRFNTGKDGNVLITSRLGRTLDIPDGSDRDGVRVQVYDPNGDSNQRFMFRRAGGRPGWDDRDWRDGGGRDQGRGDDRGGDRGGPDRGRTITCSSDNGRRVYCDADTRNGISLVRQISGSPCRQGETWGFDRRGIWVDRGCRAEFAAGRAR
jgi:hypothetical protein